MPTLPTPTPETRIVIDAEFRDNLQPLDGEERAQLTALLLEEGCRDPLVLWGDILIDGHNRYAICSEYHLPFSTIQRDFESRSHALLWQIQTQHGRRNVSLYWRGIYANREKELLNGIYRSKVGKPLEAVSTTPSGTTDAAPVLSGLKELKQPVNARKESAQHHDVSTGTAHKVGQIEQNAPAPLREAARKGEISVNRAFDLVQKLKELPTGNQSQAAELCGDNLDKVSTLVRLYKSQGKAGSNGTYTEILATGGFHYGDEMKFWCDFKLRPIRDIDTGLRDVAKLHRDISVPPPLPDELLVVLFPKNPVKSIKALEKAFGELAYHELVASFRSVSLTP